MVSAIFFGMEKAEYIHTGFYAFMKVIMSLNGKELEFPVLSMEGAIDHFFATLLNKDNGSSHLPEGVTFAKRRIQFLICNDLKKSVTTPYSQILSQFDFHVYFPLRSLWRGSTYVTPDEIAQHLVSTAESKLVGTNLVMVRLFC